MRARAAIYCRISEKDEKVDKVDRQRERCLEFAASVGYEVVGLYEDDGISAFKATTRPGYDELTQDAEAKLFDVIVAVRQDRLSRDWWVTAKLVRACQQSEIKLHTLQEGQNDLVGMGALLALVHGFQAGEEQTKKIASQREAYDKRRAEGMPLWGNRPFGFEVDRINHRAAEAATISWAYEALVGGATIYSIQKELNRRGTPTSTGGTWSYQAVKQLLLRPSNAGLMSIDGAVDRAIKVAWKPIVSVETFDRACAIVNDPDRKHVPRDTRWLLSGLAICGVCGDVLSPTQAGGSGGKPLRTHYRCRSKTRALDDGRRHVSFPAVELDRLARAATASSLVMLPSSAIGTKPSEVAEIEAVAAELADVRRRQDDLAEALAAGAIKRAAAIKHGVGLSERELELQQRRDDLEARSAHAAVVSDALLSVWKARSRRTHKIDLARVARVRRDVEDRFDLLPLSQRRTLVRSLLTITVHPWTGPSATERVEIRHLLVPSLDADETDLVEEPT